MDQTEGIRINKYLSEVGYCSRRAADQLIERGRVKINGLVPEMGTKVMPGDTVVVPSKIDRESTYNFAVRALKDWTMIISNLGIGAAAIKTLSTVEMDRLEAGVQALTDRLTSELQVLMDQVMAEQRMGVER